MSKKHPTKSNRQLISRQFAFGSFTAQEDGRVSVSFDFSKAPVPKEVYSASHAFLKSGPGHDVFLVFAQVDASTNEIKHNLQIKFDDVALVNAWRNSQDFYSSISRWYAATYGSEPKILNESLPSNSIYHQLSANLMLLGHQETSGIASFYWFDPLAARDIALGKVPNKDLMAQPVVQIKLNSHLLWQLLSGVSDYINGLMTKYPSLVAKMTPEKLGEANV